MLILKLYKVLNASYSVLKAYKAVLCMPCSLKCHLAVKYFVTTILYIKT